MANYDFYIVNEQIDRVLFIKNARSENDVSAVEDSVNRLLWACEEYMYYRLSDTGPYDNSEEYERDIENAAKDLGEVLGCELRNESYFSWYIDDTSIEGYELPIVWSVSSSDDIYAVVVRGNVISVGNIPKWEWDKLNGSYTKNVETVKKANKAVLREIKNEATGERYGNRDFSFRVWNDLCEKTKAVLDAVYENTGDPTFEWNDTYATYEDTLMSEDSRYLSAARFNSLRYNIGIHESTGLPVMADGQDVKLSYFTTVINSLNALIVAHGLGEE